MRQFKCQYCKNKDIDEKMVIVKHGKQNKRYHKVECYDLYIKDQEFKQQEKLELDELVEVIKEVHGIEVVPPQFFSYLQDLRNGNQLFGKVGQKKSKSGYSYKAISMTYEENKDTINWAKNNRDFNGTMNLLKYTRAIVADKVGQVAYRIESRDRKREFEKATEQQAESVFEHINKQPKKYKKTDSKKDASSFLD
ncbi:hypothetical protein [Aquibacillus saliphilus]|uniref:hypothetical protein n=1 Tax=Aquibacillus saliphilus TaxID=1909422 RepID=UPI001CF013F0|nr:hypothetical protein [Aquibacillus saliphilus]